MKKKYLPFLFCICLLPLTTFGQQQTGYRISGKSLPELRRAEQPDLKASGLKSPVVPKTWVAPKTRSMPKVWSYRDLSFFCKVEVRLEKATRFPVKFRLGEVQYVERMEGKRE